MEATKVYDNAKACEAQSKYCKDRGAPYFAPGNGRCYRCGRDIYAPLERPDGRVTGIDVEQVGSTLITGCPHCNATYCE